MLDRFINQHPLPAFVVLTVVLLGLGFLIGINLPDFPPTKTERRLDAIEKRLDALEAAQKRPVAR